jgi:hypothetical protein
MMIQSIIPWKGPCAKWILEKLGCLWCFEINYPTEEDPEARQIEVNTVLFRKSVEKCECTRAVCGCCTIHGPAATVDSHSDAVDPSTSLFDPMTKLYRHLGLPGPEHGCGKWCTVHGPNLDASSDNVLFAPSAATIKYCCSELSCCAEAKEESQSAMNTNSFEFVDKQPVQNPVFAADINFGVASIAEAANDYLEVGATSTSDATAAKAKKKSKTSPSMSTTGADSVFKKIDVGKRVTVEGYNGFKGTIRFVGKHAIEKTPRVGVELDEPIGKSNGTVKGHTYFECRAKHGVLVKPGKVTLVKKK